VEHLFFEFICERFFSAFSIIQKVQRRQSCWLYDKSNYTLCRFTLRQDTRERS